MPYDITPNDDKCACQNAILIPDTRIECSIELYTTTITNTTVNVCPSTYLGLDQD